MTASEFKGYVKSLCKGRPYVSVRDNPFPGPVMRKVIVCYGESGSVVLSHFSESVLLTELTRQLQEMGKLKCTESTTR